MMRWKDNLRYPFSVLPLALPFPPQSLQDFLGELVPPARSPLLRRQREEGSLDAMQRAPAHPNSMRRLFGQTSATPTQQARRHRSSNVVPYLPSGPAGLSAGVSLPRAREP